MKIIILISIDTSLDNWLPLFGLLSVYEILYLRKRMVVGHMT